MRMLDNVIDINYYAVAKARNSNLKHRPVGLGIMGFQDCLHLMRMPYGSAAAMQFADASMEAVCYHAYWASTELAEERGRYPSYQGQPVGSRRAAAGHAAAAARRARRLCRHRRIVDARLGRAARSASREHGMRNSNCVAIAPTATISNIIGVAASIEPDYQNIYVKSNLSGEFTVVNEQLVARPEGARPVGRRDGVRPQVLRRLAREDRPRARAAARAVRDGVRDRRRRGSSRPVRAGRSGSTRRRASTSTWRARRARSSTTRTSSRGCAASRRRTTCARWRRRPPRSRPAGAAS